MQKIASCHEQCGSKLVLRKITETFDLEKAIKLDYNIFLNAEFACMMLGGCGYFPERYDVVACQGVILYVCC